MDDRTGLTWIVFGAAVLTGALIILFTAKTGSKSVSFAAGTTISGILFFVLTVIFTLKPASPEREPIPAKFYLNNAPAIEVRPSGPLIAVLDASYWLYRTNPAAFQSERDLLLDLVTLEICNFLFSGFVDWQAVRFTVENSFGTLRFPPNIRAQATDSTVIEKQTVQAQLSKTENLFFGAPIAGGNRVLLPPEARVEVGRRLVVVGTPFCEVRFSPSGVVEALESGGPATPTSKQPPTEAQVPVHSAPVPEGATVGYPGGFTTDLPDHDEWIRRLINGKVTTYGVQVVAETRFSALRAEHFLMNDRKSFCRNLVAQARDWFANQRVH